MRIGLLMLASLCLAGCSCGRDPAPEPPAAAPGATVEQAAPAEPVAASAPDPQALLAQERTTTALMAAVSTVHAYLAALTRRDMAAADGFWVGGHPPAPAGDGSLRAIDDLRSAQIRNGRARPLDAETPPRSIEVPIRLRVQAASGSRRIEGWYRVTADPSGAGWRISDAALQPVLE
ncbi:hypothetical protein [Coralloluteibacterium stylophorae]|uniref:Nuclear transport factor 2 family protein n=1 Tax=Coralloluteibacterium stylophorae TaxID=1776034 RepID=A0AAP2G1Q4_9GAMM|nr:hypothetical protein [Coralloluteibacterium stylophorae]MBS7457953.1 hypothetical protein [Coralloluteibacterium stylophorae]